MTPHFLLLFRWHVLRHLRRHRLLALLNVLAIALGVAVYVAIQTANYSANRTFAASVDLVAGKAQLEARGDLDENLLPLLARQPEVAAATPLIEQLVTLPDFPGEYLRVLGVDVFTNAPFRTFEIERGTDRFDIENWLAQPNGIALNETFAKEHGLKIGDYLAVMANGQQRALPVTCLLKFDDAPAAVETRFAAMDIGWAQEFFAMRGKLSSVQLLLRDPSHIQTTIKHLRSLLPGNITLAPPRQRSVQIDKMLAAFQLNMTALSMVSLLVGTFLIYNTVSASAARRRTEIGILRAIGTTRGEIRALFLGEAALFGMLGILVGEAGGIWLARGLVGSVTKTISTLYVLVSVQHPVLSATHLGVAAVFGFGAVLAGAWVPANEAARVDPVAALTPGARFSDRPRIKSWWALAGIGALASSGLCCFLAFAWRPWFGFAAAFFILIGFSFFAPGATTLFSPFLSRASALWPRLASENLARSTHRNAVTIAALAAAVAMAVGVSVMIFSFRESVNTWIQRGIVADLFIAPAANEIIGLNAFMPAEVVAALRKMPGVTAVDTFRQIDATMRGETVEIGVVRGADRRNLHFVGGSAERKMARFFSGEDRVIVTESFAQKQRVRDGDALPIATPTGVVNFQVAGVYYDYTNDRGTIMMDQSLFQKYWHDDRVMSVAVYLAPGADPEKVDAEFRHRFSAHGEMAIYPNRALRRRILAIFDQTFAVTYVLRAIAVLVAAIGIFLSVTALVIERERDIGIFRALGASRVQVRNLFLLESGMIGALASLLGLTSGLGLALVLTWVINKAFFGWTIDLQIPTAQLAVTPFWIIASAVAAAWWPAVQAGRQPIARAVRNE